MINLLLTLSLIVNIYFMLQSIFIQNLLSGSPGVQVSTVDGYQGREKEVIIFSFVRSNQHKQLGFVKNERRLNVAVTRAKKFFAVVADSRTVSTCKIIKELITNIPLDGIFEDGETYLAGKSFVSRNYSQNCSWR